jgi:hypothetical protein
MPEDENHRPAPIDRTGVSPMDSSANFSGGLNKALIEAATAEDRVKVAELVALQADQIAKLVSNEKERGKVSEAIKQMAVRIQGGDNSQQEEIPREEDTD